MLKIDIQPIRGVLFVRLSGKLERKNVSKLNKEVIMLIKKAKIKNIVLNIKKLDYIDYYGKNAILNSIRICHFNKGTSFICLKENQKKILKTNYLKYPKIIKNEISVFSVINP